MRSEVPALAHLNDNLPMQPRLLIIDDEDSDRFVLKRILSRANVDLQVDECSDGVEALQYIEDVHGGSRIRPDLILVDLNMPRIGGIEFLRRYQEQVTAHPGLESPVLMMLTVGSREDEKACLQFDVVKGIISKDPEQSSRSIEAIARELAAGSQAS